MIHVQAFFDPDTFTLTYVVYDAASKDAVIIDPVLDYDAVASTTAAASPEKVAGFLRTEGLRLHFVLETHAHADHLSAAQYFKRHFDAKIAIGARITEVQSTFKEIFDLPESFRADGGQFDRLLQNGEVVKAGALAIEVIATPGHTPACVSYLIDDALFAGDTLFLEDYGCGRCDFPRGSASDLYASVHDRLYKLPDATRVFVGHDYQPHGRPLRFETTIGASKSSNIQLAERTKREEFIAFRTARDATLTPPRLLFPSVQVNIDAGRLPAPHANGMRYFRIPVNMKSPTDDDGTPRSA